MSFAVLGEEQGWEDYGAMSRRPWFRFLFYHLFTKSLGKHMAPSDTCIYLFNGAPSPGGFLQEVAHGEIICTQQRA